MVLLVCTSGVNKAKEVQAEYGADGGQYIEVPLWFTRSQFYPHFFEVDSTWRNEKAATKYRQMCAQALEGIGR